MIVDLKVDRVRKETLVHPVQQAPRVIKVRPVRPEPQVEETVTTPSFLPVKVLTPLDRMIQSLLPGGECSPEIKIADGKEIA